MPHKIGHTFDHIASRTARAAGSAYAFGAAIEQRFRRLARRAPPFTRADDE